MDHDGAVGRIVPLLFEELNACDYFTCFIGRQHGYRSVCVSVSVCEREREKEIEGEREGERERKREKERKGGRERE